MADRGGSAPHTPGEWKVTRFGYKASYAVDGPNGEQIGTLSEWKDAPEEQEANAHLIASAPELGQELLDTHLERICLNVECKDCKRIEALLKKAGLLP